MTLRYCCNMHQARSDVIGEGRLDYAAGIGYLSNGYRRRRLALSLEGKHW